MKGQDYLAGEPQTQENNIQNMNSRYGTWTNASKPYTALPDCYHRGNRTIVLELE